MCTLVVLNSLWPRYPLIIAANRDENPARPTQGPAYLTEDVFAPRDLVLGGSWIGVNRRGLAAALTNRHLNRRVRGRRSRGLLVTESLAAPDLATALRHVLASPAGTYNGFNLVLADSERAVLVWTDGAELDWHELRRGYHVFTGEGSGLAHSPRASEVTRRLQIHGLRDAPTPSWLFSSILDFHLGGPDDGTCVHGDGCTTDETIFSSVIEMNAALGHWRLEWRYGRPCAGPRRPLTTTVTIGDHDE